MAPDCVFLPSFLTSLDVLAIFRCPFSLAVPCLARPIVRGHLAALALDAAAACAVRLFAGRLILLDGHVRVTKANDLFLAALTRLHNELLPAAFLAAGFVAWHLGLIDALTRHQKGCPKPLVLADQQAN